MIPAAVPAAVMFVEPGTRTAEVIAAIIPVAADAETELGSAGDRRDRNGRRSHGSEYQLPHVPLQSLLRTRENEHRGPQLLEHRRNFFEWMFTIVASLRNARMD